MSFRKFCGFLACLLLICCVALPAFAQTTVSVTDAAYGADGSDTKDDTAAIQKALDLGKSATTDNPLVVNVPAGTYYISSELKIYSNTTLKLDAKATIVRSTDTIRMLASGYGQNTDEGKKGGYGQLQNVTITGGTWDGNVSKNGSGQGSNAINLMTLWHGKNITFSSMTMKSVCGTHFVEFNSIDTLRVSGVTFQDFVPYSGLNYDYTTASDDGDITDKVEGVSIYSEAVQLDYAMKDNSVSAYPYDKTPCKNVTISGCTFKNCLSGIGNHHSDVVSTNITISGNTFSNMSASCINLPNMTGVTVSGNTAKNVRSFLRATYGTNVTVSNNTITYGFTSVTAKLQQDVFNIIKATATLNNNKVYGTGKRAVIATDGTVTLNGNTFDLSSFRPDGYNAVQMSGSKVKIINNTITNAASTAIDLISVSSASGYTQVEGNTITTTGSQGIRLEKCSGLTVKSNTVTKASEIGIRVVSSTDVTASDNTISNPGTQALSIEGSTVTADSNIIKSPGANGIVATSSSTLNATGNTIDSAKTNAISVTNSTATLSSNKINGCSGQGIRAEGSTVTANGNTITAPGGNGLLASDGASLTAKNNTITGAKSNGVSITGSAASLSGNTITDSVNSGIRIADSAKKVTISSTTVNGITGSSVNAVYITNATNVTLNGCTVTGATAAGIRVVENSKVTIKNCQIKKAATQGINVQDSKVTLSGTTVSNPGAHGIYLNGATFVVSGNTVTGVQSGFYAIRIVDDGSVKSSGTLLDNTGTVSNAASGKIVDKLDTPTLTGVSNTAEGIQIKWDEVVGAVKYRVFYKIDGGWTKLADTDATSYTWTGAKSDTTYTFTVRCLSADGKTFTSDFDSTGLQFSNGNLATPKISSVANAANGVTITWGKVTGAAKYRVFYKTGGSGWTKLADTDATSYTWTGGKAGTTYTFTVRCLSADGTTFTSAYDAAGTSFTYSSLDAPKLSSVANAANGVTITWGKVTGAAKYRVFYKTGGSGWTKLADTDATSYTWTSAKSGTAYTFTVRCLSADGSTFTSAYDTAGTSFTYSSLAAPKISTLSNAANGVTITWGKVSGAAMYRVFYKTASGWAKLTDTAATSYTWTGAKSGTSYTFTVRCVSADGKTFTSAYDTTGKTIAYLAAPKISALANATNGLKITWGKVTGAAKYRVFYKTGSSGWTKLTDTDATSYTWTGAKSGTAYTFTVRCISADGKTYTSAYDTTGTSFTYGSLAAPKISDLANAANGVTITWGKVSGAAKYRVFYKTGSGSWTKLADTSANSYTWTGAKSGTTYTFTVRCISADGSTFTSTYDTTGKTLTYVAAPKISSVKNVSKGIEITWGKVSGAAKYRVFYKTGGSGWTKLTDTDAASYTWTGAQAGSSYTFTVRCLGADGKTYTSAYDTTGTKITH